MISSAILAQHLHESLDTGLELLGVGVGIVGLDAQNGDAGGLHGLFHIVALGIVQAAELQVDIDDAVHLVLFGQAQQIVDGVGAMVGI